MRSMTGYGRRQLSRDGREITVEIKTVNHRFLDVASRLPRALSFAEDAVRKQLSASLRRGHADVAVTYTNLRTDARTVTVDEALALQYKAALDKLGAMLDGQEAPGVPRAYQERLQARLSELGVKELDEQRLAQEVALMADHCAIDEELSRLESHIAQMRQAMAEDGEVGRRLDFLTQELNREVNTIGSKASDAEITKLVVAAKSEIEKLREQVQNVE